MVRVYLTVEVGRRIFMSLFLSSDPMYFPGRAARVYYRPPPEKRGKLAAIKQTIESVLHVSHDLDIGTLGILHPTVLEKFEIGFPCSALEFTLEPFKKQMQRIWTNDD